MMPYTVSFYGNPHSRTHAYGWESEQAVEKARQVTKETYVLSIPWWKPFPGSYMLCR